MRINFRQKQREFIDDIFIWCCPYVIIDGLWIGIHMSGRIDNIREALNLIKKYDTIRYKRILHDVKRIWIVPDAGGMGKYLHRKKLIILNSLELEGVDPKIVASVIVHEATHARLMRFGYNETIRSRVERCCTRRELAFSRRYPDGDDIARWVSDSLLLPDDSWSDVSLRDMEREGAIKALRELSAPRWITRILLDKQSRKMLGDP